MLRGAKRLTSRKKMTVLFCGVACVCLVLFINDIRKSVSIPSSLNQWPRLRGPLQLRGAATVRSMDDQASALPVLLVTYMRSGSSVCGDILQQAAGAFYNYEPVRLVERAAAGNKTILHVNGTHRYPPFSVEKETYGVLRNWLSCDLQRLTMNSLQDGFLSRGNKTKHFLPCYKATNNVLHNKTASLNKCLTELQKRCIESPVRVIKTIRTPLETAKKLITEFPNLKIIHLVRDPRATLASQKKMGMCNTKHNGPAGCTYKYCKRLENDVIESERLQETNPDNIMTVFYEDIAIRPLETAKAMYEFVGTTFTAHAEAYVYNITMAGNPNNCAICTTRTNSSEHVDSWKQKMKRSFIDIIQERCNYVLRRFKYKLV